MRGIDEGVDYQDRIKRLNCKLCKRQLKYDPRRLNNNRNISIMYSLMTTLFHDSISMKIHIKIKFFYVPHFLPSHKSLIFLHVVIYFYALLILLTNRRNILNITFVIGSISA